MKMLLPSMLIFSKNKINSYMVFMPLMMIFMLMKMSNNFMLYLNQFSMLDYLSFIMILLTLISVTLIILSSESNNMKIMSPLIFIIMFILMITFSMSNIFNFYIMFELILIPTMILITKSGKQPERLQAGIYLIMYTITASLPLLITILYIKNNLSFFIMYLSMMKFKFIMLMMMAFLVKMPMFFTHLWLPKAHVEAPLEGSMILAAILLKLGGYGLLRILPSSYLKISLISPWIISISLIGASSTSLNCIRQKDMKALIAYSSVAHMGLTLCSMFSMNYIGLYGAVMMMFAHGLSSSALFLLVNDLYLKIHSRNILMFKGLMILTPNITFWWFMFMAINISAPPSINTFSEIFIMTSLIMWNSSLMMPIMVASLSAASFSLLLFVNMNHNKNEMLPFFFTKQKTFLSLFMHLTPLIILIAKMELFMLLYSLYKTLVCGTKTSHMMMYFMNMMMLISIPMMTTLILLFNNMFISIEIPLINFYSFNMPISIILDWVSCMFLTTVMFISSMIIMFSMNYMPKNNHNKFSLMLIMFVLSMSLLIMSDNIIFILLGWDGLGLSSYILVIYYQNFSSAASGTITILSNRIGDIMILVSISIMMMNSNWNFSMNKEFNLMTLTLLLTAACSKSAQFPFSAWLPAAMAAPTPISALVHSSTLVTAGVYILIRIMNNNHTYSMYGLMIVSSMTSIYASMAANWEHDMKKIIALSTLSQIALMMFAISIKSSIMAFFHLITHALFKSSMFLCAGNMIHSSSYQDMRSMGLSMMKSPMTSSMLGLSSMALMGLPFMSGFFSKDVIIEFLIYSKSTSFMSILMIISIGMTICYSIRMSYMANKFSLKSKSDYIFHNNKFSTTSILIMAPMSIIMGSVIMWSINIEQVFIIPLYLKLLIPIMIITGFMMGIMLFYKSKNFIKMGESSISLWFIHLMSTYPMKMLSPPMNQMSINDKYWQELYGPQGLYFFSKNLSKLPNFMMLTLMMILMMMFMLPLII